MSENSKQRTGNLPRQDSTNGAKQHSRKFADAVPFAQRLGCTIPEACAATGLGRTKLYELIGAGCVETTLIGRRRLVSVKSLLHLIGHGQGGQQPG